MTHPNGDGAGFSTVFEALSDRDADVIRALMETRSYPRGETVIATGEAVDALLVIEEGFLSVRSGDITIAFFGRGELLGEMSFLDDEGASAEIVAESDVRLSRLPNVALARALSDQPLLAARVYRSLARSLARRLRETSRRLSVFASQRHSDNFVERTARIERTGDRVALDPAAGNLSDEHLDDAILEAAIAFRAQAERIERDVKRVGSQGSGKKRVAALCERIVELVDKTAAMDDSVQRGYRDLLSFRDPQVLAASACGFIFRETFPILMRSRCINRLYAKPFGYAEDFITTTAIIERDIAGDGAFGEWVDAWFLERPICQARRSAEGALRDVLTRVGAGAKETLRICVLGAGAANEALDFALRHAAAGELQITCIDQDPEALRNLGAEAELLGAAPSLRYVCADVRTLGRAATGMNMEPQDVVYGLGVLDYLSDEEARQLLAWSSAATRAGGEVWFDVLRDTMPDRSIATHLLHWPLRWRTDTIIESLAEFVVGEGEAVRRPLPDPCPPHTEILHFDRR